MRLAPPMVHTTDRLHCPRAIEQPQVPLLKLQLGPGLHEFAQLLQNPPLIPHAASALPARHWLMAQQPPLAQGHSRQVAGVGAAAAVGVARIPPDAAGGVGGRTVLARRAAAHPVLGVHRRQAAIAGGAIGAVTAHPRVTAGLGHVTRHALAHAAAIALTALPIAQPAAARLAGALDAGGLAAPGTGCTYRRRCRRTHCRCPRCTCRCGSSRRCRAGWGCRR